MKHIKAQIIIRIFKLAVYIFSKLSNYQITKVTDFFVWIYTIFPNQNQTYPQFLVNNAVIYPDKSKEEIKELSKVNTFIALAGLFFSLKYSSEKYKNNLDLNLVVSGKDNLKDIDMSKGVICVASHLGLNTLTLKYLAHTINKDCLAIMRQSWGNEELETFVRNHYGDDMVTIVKLGGAMSDIEKTLNKGGLVVLAVDAVLPVNHKHPVDYFGTKFDLSTGPAWLARKLNVPIITGYGTFDRESLTVHINIDKELKLESTKEKTTEKLAQRLEKYVYDNPGQWYQSDDYFQITGKKN